MTEFEQVGPLRLYPRAAAAPGYCLSCDGLWLPGAYQDRDAAMLAAGAWICDWERASKQLAKLQERANRTPSGLITVALLRWGGDIVKHHPTLHRGTWTRGCWASCCCGWTGRWRWTTPVGAHLEFGRHLVEVAR